MEKEKKEKKTRKDNLLLTDLIGPVIAVENILVLLFYFWWYFVVDNKPGLTSYIIIYLIVFINILLIVLSIVSLFRLLSKKIKISKNLKRDKINFSVVGIILGVILLIFSSTIANSLHRYKEVTNCNKYDVVKEIGIGRSNRYE